MRTPTFFPLLLRLFLVRELVTLTSLPMAVYVDVLLLSRLGLDFEGKWVTVAKSLALTYTTSGVMLSLGIMGWLLRRALRVVPGEPEGQRLERLLTLPWQLILLGNLAMWVLGGVLINTSIAVSLGKLNDNLWLIPAGMAVATGVGLLNGSLLFVLYERMLMPYALEEYQRRPRALQAPGGLLRPRQRWFLPYVLASLLFGTLIFTGTVVWVRLGLGALEAHLLLLPLSFTLTLLLCGSVLTAWWIGRRQSDGAAAIYTSLEGLTHGNLQPPRWVSTDEIGDLATGVWRLFDQLQELPRELQAVTHRLAEAGTHLVEASALQQQTLERQSLALHKTVTTAEQIQQTSWQARSRVQSVQAVSRRTAELGREGEHIISQSLQWLADIGTTTQDIRAHVAGLAQHTREIERIISTVKDLAARSNVLALNASIQAVQVGKEGLGFNVVAREFRSLADSSLQATRQVRALLERLGGAIGNAITLVDRGAHGVSETVSRLNSISPPLHELALLAQQSSSAMREITTSVEQQHQGIHQLFEAIHELKELTDKTVAQRKATQQAAHACEEVSSQVTGIARRYTAGKA